MKKFIIIIGLLLFIGGGVLLGISLSNGALSNASVELLHHEKSVDEAFNNIKLDIATADVVFEKSEDDKCMVLLDEREKYYHIIEVKDDTLTITAVDEYKFYERLVPMIGNMKVTIKLPHDTYNSVVMDIATGDIESKMNLTLNEFKVNGSTGDVSIENMIVNGEMNLDISTGDITLLNTTCSTLNVDVSTGKTNLTNFNAGDITLIHTTGKVNFETVRAGKVTIDGSTGKVNLTDAIFTGHLFIKTSTGDVTFKDSDADTIEVIGDTADVTGNLLTGKTFITETSTGKNKPQPGSTGNVCKITTSTGDIIITVGN